MIKTFPTLRCPGCGANLFFDETSGDSSPWKCPRCAFTAPGTKNLIDLLPDDTNKTSQHYSKQWGDELGFLKFIQGRPTAKGVMPSAKLGWEALFSEIRDKTKTQRVTVYDAACGFGGLANELITDQTFENISYIGADIHNALNSIRTSIKHFDECGTLVRWDISNPLPVNETFDYVLCRASLHHTPNPRRSFDSLCSALKPGGTIAISVYRKKGLCREASDDALRRVVSAMSPEEAFDACRQFTILGRALQQVTETVHLQEDVPLLGIRKGDYRVQELVYYHLLKCFNNEEFGEQYSTLVNYDWYHPPFAYRYDIDEILTWFAENQLEVLVHQSIEVQHYVAGRKAC